MVKIRLQVERATVASGATPTTIPITAPTSRGDLAFDSDHPFES
jgi:hypothetical protein